MDHCEFATTPRNTFADSIQLKIHNQLTVGLFRGEEPIKIALWENSWAILVMNNWLPVSLMSPCKHFIYVMTHCESGEPCCGVKRGSGETHISSSGTRPSLCTRPGVDLLRAIAAANTHHASLQRKVKGTGSQDIIQQFVQKWTVLVANKYL
jgi:hypothetical protein